jgi:hypothetical protein
VDWLLGISTETTSTNKEIEKNKENQEKEDKK